MLRVSLHRPFEYFYVDFLRERTCPLFQKTATHAYHKNRIAGEEPSRFFEGEDGRIAVSGLRGVAELIRCVVSQYLKWG